MIDDYRRFVSQKLASVTPVGITGGIDISTALFPFQSDVVRWALRRGRAAVFADCGMGKTLIQLEWARHIPGKVLILAPLAVGRQTEREGARFGIDCAYSRSGARGQITIANYEMLPHFDPDEFAGIVLDESSILKSYSGKTRNEIIEAFQRTPYRLACTATPSPNDYMELGNHSEFLGIMTRTEMLSMFFVHDGGETQSWRLKGHAEKPFWKWMASWSVMLRRPSDLGYSDEGFILPPLRFEEHVVPSDSAAAQAAGFLFQMEALTLQEQRATRRASMRNRVSTAAALANDSDEPWVIWCELNDESTALASEIDGAVEVTGSMTNLEKEAGMLGFSTGRHRVMVSKASVAGFGMNWQHCPNVAFVGATHSYEQTYQAIRRCWRFGQQRPVTVHSIRSEGDSAISANLKRKERDAEKMAEEMLSHVKDIQSEEIRGACRQFTAHAPRQSVLVPSWLTSEAA